MWWINCFCWWMSCEPATIQYKSRTILCNISHGFNWHNASRGPSATAALLITDSRPYCLHCCKGDQLYPRRMGKLGLSELRKPKPQNRYRSALSCVTVMLRRYHRICQNLKWSPYLGRLGMWVKYHCRMVFSFPFCDSKFCSRLEPKPHNWFYAVI